MGERVKQLHNIKIIDFCYKYTDKITALYAYIPNTDSNVNFSP